jgi:glutamine synthetase
MASQIYAGLDGIARRLDPGQSADEPYEHSAALLPKNLGEALTALSADEALRDGFGASFLNYYAHIKNAELARFQKDSGKDKDQVEPTPWEHREYFDMF